MVRVGTGGSTLEYSEEECAAQRPCKKIGQMGEVPLPKEKSELVSHSDSTRSARYPAPGDTLRSDGPIKRVQSNSTLKILLSMRKGLIRLAYRISLLIPIVHIVANIVV